MSVKKPIKWKEMDFDKLKVGLDKKTVKLYYEKKDENNNSILEDFQIQLPHMHLPFGLKENENKNQWSNFKEYYFDCGLKDFSEKDNFNQFLTNLNNKVMTLINESKNFKDNCNENNYYKIHKSNNLIKLNLLRDKEGNFNSYVFKYNSGKKHEKILLKDENIYDVVKQGTMFIPTINCSKIYFYKEKFGSIWNIVQMLTIEKTEKKSDNNVYTAYSFV